MPDGRFEPPSLKTSRLSEAKLAPTTSASQVPPLKR
jgi:hypothetical protein